MTAILTMMTTTRGGCVMCRPVACHKLLHLHFIAELILCAMIPVCNCFQRHHVEFRCRVSSCLLTFPLSLRSRLSNHRFIKMFARAAAKRVVGARTFVSRSQSRLGGDHHEPHPLFHPPYSKKLWGGLCAGAVIGGAYAVVFAGQFQNKKHGFPIAK